MSCKKRSPRAECPRAAKWSLFTEVELFNDGAVALDVVIFEVIEHAATFTDEADESTLRDLVFAVFLHQLGEVLDAIGEKSDLRFGGTRVGCTFTILGVDFLFFLFCKIHSCKLLF